MKKFCSKCGTQLDLGKRACTSCQAFNPYFISGFVSNEPVLQVNKSVPAEEVLPAKEQSVNNEALLAEQAERERVELELKNELLKVKEETKQYKNETLNLIKDVQKELKDLRGIDNENKVLKEQVPLLSNITQAEKIEVLSIDTVPIDKPGQPKWFMGAAAVVLALIIAGFTYFLLNRTEKREDTTPANIVQPVNVTNTPQPAKTNNLAVANMDTTHKHPLLAVVAPIIAKAPVSPASLPPTKQPASAAFSLTTAKAMGDLVGKKLSGCDIIINSSSEIEHLDNLILVEKLSATYLKYKCSIKVKQGNEVYTSSPYIYYSANGTFIKVDGTNCE